MLIVKPILIVDMEITNHSRGISLIFYYLHSMQYRRLNLLTSSGRSRVSSLNIDL